MLSKDVCGSSEAYINSKIVALWRNYFPVPTSEPTQEEITWCRERLINYDALRENELNCIAE